MQKRNIFLECHFNHCLVCACFDRPSGRAMFECHVNWLLFRACFDRATGRAMFECHLINCCLFFFFDRATGRAMFECHLINRCLFFFFNRATGRGMCIGSRSWSVTADTAPTATWRSRRRPAHLHTPSMMTGNTANTGTASWCQVSVVKWNASYGASCNSFGSVGLHDFCLILFFFKIFQ